jgi:hypothetical protein
VLILRLVVVCATPLLLTAQSTSESPPLPPPLFIPPHTAIARLLKMMARYPYLSKLKSKSSKNALNACYK